MSLFKLVQYYSYSKETVIDNKSKLCLLRVLMSTKIVLLFLTAAQILQLIYFLFLISKFSRDIIRASKLLKKKTIYKDMLVLH